MGKHFALTLQLPKYSLERRSRNANSFANTGNWGIIVLAISCLMIVGYLVEVNSFSTKGYEISGLQRKVDQLKEDQRQLEVQAAQLQSLQRIQNDPAVQNMVPVSKVSYVQNQSLTKR